MTLDLEEKKIKGHFFACFTSRKGRIFIVGAEIVWYIESKEREKNLEMLCLRQWKIGRSKKTYERIIMKLPMFPGIGVL